MAHVIIDLISTKIDEQEKERLLHPQTSGVILFGRNCESTEQVRQLTDEVRGINPNLLIYIDQEGGRVQRIRTEIDSFAPMAALGLRYQQAPEQALHEARLQGWLMASHILSAGVDVSFAPVLDRDYQKSLVIGDRAFAKSTEGIIKLASAFMEGMHEAGMATVGKHFPGHGFVVPDSHLELPVDPRPYSQIARDDLCIFEQLFDLTDGLMPAHIVFEQVDQNPTCFSSHWLNDILRESLGFTGAVFSDDLSMQGAAIMGDMSERVQKALLAGCTQVLVCNSAEVQQAALDAASAIAAELPLANMQGFKAAHYPTWEEVQAMPMFDEAKQVQQGLIELWEQQ
ncbi:MAG: beta-N-acetylhexosaminidase [Pseudomonadota bacterium]|nr:beta-N-acetylhexosaminidase [Pseudomonadota bacterium]